MSIIDFRTTHWMYKSHPEVKRWTSIEVMSYYDNELKYVQLFPDDIVVITMGSGWGHKFVQVMPADLELYKHIWDLVGNKDRQLLCKHFKRCQYIRYQIKEKEVPDTILTWYMAIILGSNEEC